MSLSNRFVLLLSLCCVSQIAFAEDIGFTKQYSVCMDKSDGVTSNMIDCIVAETKHQDARLNKVYKAFMAELSAERKSNSKPHSAHGSPTVMQTVPSILIRTVGQ